MRQDIIHEGNAAAHGGNGTADAWLLNSNFIPEEYKQIFSTIYCYGVDSYLTLPMKLRKALDIHASIFAGVRFHAGLSSTPKRRAIFQVLLKIQHLCTSLGNDSFEQSPEVADLLAQAESMKDELVKSYKQRFDRN